MKRVLKILGIVFAVFIGLAIIAAIFGGNSNQANGDSEAPAQEEQKSTPKSKWEYSEKSNEMDNTTTYFASLTSKNKIEFEFPYDGGSSFQFIVRKTNGQYDFLVTVSKGQFMTNILENEKLRIRFDDGEPFDWQYSSANDARADIIFPEFSDDFLAQLKASKKMMIEAPFAFAGRQVIQFETGNLKSDF